MKKRNKTFQPTTNRDSLMSWEEMFDEAEGSWRDKITRRQARQWRHSLRTQ